MSSQVYIKVAGGEDEDPIEVPLEPDNTLLLPTLTAQFSKCTGLKYKATESNCFRGLRLAEGRIYPPEGEWGDIVYYCVFPKDNKRKCDDDVEDKNTKIKCLEGRRCTDLIVLNLPWQTDETSLRKYFSRFGDLVMVQLKKDPNTNKSRGYGFIRFNDYSAQVMCLAEQHVIDNRVCDVRIPISKVEGDRQDVCRKIHVGGLTEEIGAEALREFFSKYGRVVDVFIPKPFRSFAFVTFDDPDSATSVMGKELKIKDCTVTIGSAVPKLPAGNRQNQTTNQMQSTMLPLASSQNGQMWNAAWPGMYGMFPGPPPMNGDRDMGRGGAFGGPMGLNPAAAAAAATLAAQYTRAHQRQNSAASGSATEIASSTMNSNYATRPGSGGAGNDAAMATLSILNNPSVVAAIVSAASGNQPNQTPSYMNSTAR
ncbi:unnamed protein product [Calicophoron daubneyi]|uniref:RRM domain-containing protein n=1 Tax=Calicophoron daubneyi TaxID=300641 RepID=A0AAV2TQV1_CALDB